MNMRECQAESLESGSKSMPRAIDLSRRAIEYSRRNGFTGTVRKVWHFVRDSKSAVSQPSQGAERRHEVVREEVLSLKPGETVEVKSLSEIRDTLDQNGGLRGLAFLPMMEQFCGKRFTVFKRMETLYQEESGQVRRLKNTVLLSTVQCDGLLMSCDRSCFFYWREAWLRRVDDAAAPSTVMENHRLFRRRAKSS
jgi:hypothetical protein